MTQRGPRLPSGATIVAWLGIIGTLMGIVSFFILDLPNIIGGGGGGGGSMSEASVIGTLAALQDEKNQAQLQLTQIAVANQQVANQQTQTALDQQVALFQATLDAARAAQDQVVATQNAVVAASATADAEVQAANATATQVVLDQGATAAAIAQVTPTPTDSPTNTPEPEIVTDFRSISEASVALLGSDIEFFAQTASPVPDGQAGLAYVWLLDTDRDPTTGYTVQDIGVDLRAEITFESGAWVGVVRTIQPDGTVGDAFLFFSDVDVNGPRVGGLVEAAGLAGGFDWVARSELGNETYSFFPASGHLTFTP